VLGVLAAPADHLLSAVVAEVHGRRSCGVPEPRPDGLTGGRRRVDDAALGARLVIVSLIAPRHVGMTVCRSR